MASKYITGISLEGERLLAVASWSSSSYLHSMYCTCTVASRHPLANLSAIDKARYRFPLSLIFHGTSMRELKMSRFSEPLASLSVVIETLSVTAAAGPE
ncbi:hypothetical protein N656DRAFT_186093 [Canariomyces notabilis]|uniref:Uncharacterized protein n=1 Tax=Canariomyces notabilis TaxID=2074819 RepID=A0AAN6TA84_9PEZI|nr:hypothetical protein N656DRAFT_186093 [Canariomyces arenarius]